MSGITYSKENNMKKITKVCAAVGVFSMVYGLVKLLTGRRSDAKHANDSTYTITERIEGVINPKELNDSDNADRYEFDDDFAYYMLRFALQRYGLTRDDVCLEGLSETTYGKELKLYTYDEVKYVVKGNPDTMEVVVEKYTLS